MSDPVSTDMDDHWRRLAAELGLEPPPPTAPPAAPAEIPREESVASKKPMARRRKAGDDAPNADEKSAAKPKRGRGRPAPEPDPEADYAGPDAGDEPPEEPEPPRRVHAEVGPVEPDDFDAFGSTPPADDPEVEGDSEPAAGEEGEQKRRRRRRRRRRKGSEISAAANDRPAPPDIEDEFHDDDASLESEFEQQRPPSPPRGAVIEHDSPSALSANWDVPSWNDLIAGLYRPDR